MSPAARTLDRLILEAYRRHPGRRALRLRGRTWTYRELIEKSLGLSRALRIRHGVKPGDRVALYLDRSPEAVASIYAVLLSRACYVPIDPEAPPARVRDILQNCRPRALLTRSAKIAGLEAGPALDSMARMLLDAERAPAAAVEKPGASAAADPAYILYTSGSTGRPKGVLLTHANATAFVRWALGTFALTPRDRVANLAPFQFDLSIFDLFASCGAGASLHPIPYPDSLFPASVARFLAARRITVFYTVPSVLSSVRAALGPRRAAFPDLRLLLFAGEVMPEATLRAWQEYAPRAALYNLYGPTETNVCFCYPVPRPLPPGLPSVPIGRPIPGIRILVSGAGARPVRPGGKGELCVAGPTVMRGYVDGRDGNRRAFRRVRARGAGKPSRFYRTGDIVSRGSGGNYFFWGRRDGQVKIRGFRVELGEVERVLQSHDGVAVAAVLALPEPGEGTRLAAFVAPRRGRDGVTETALRRHAASRLPAYMIPPRIRVLDSLPRLQTGKIDRLALARTGA